MNSEASASVKSDKPGLGMKFHCQDQKIQPQVHLRPALELNFCSFDNTSENRHQRFYKAYNQQKTVVGKNCGFILIVDLN